MTLSQAEINSVRSNCTAELHGHGRAYIQKTMLELADFSDPQWSRDHYGSGDIINRFEDKIARIIDKPAALFMPSGTMAQQIALRYWSDRAGSKRIGMHPSCHIYVHEEDAYRELHHLEAMLVGSPDRSLAHDDVEAVQGSVAALVVELPQRHNGGTLTAWKDLEKIRDWTEKNGTKLHLDGARLWETESFYQKSMAETAALFDSVYLSFYKGIGGIGGAVLAGSDSLIAEAKIWLRRHGGNLIHLFPYVIAADHGLTHRFPKMPAYFARAKEVAAVINDCSEINLLPKNLHTNMMHLSFNVEPAQAVACAVATSKETGLWVLGSLWKATGSEAPIFELYIGDAALNVKQSQVRAYFELLNDKLKQLAKS